MLAHKTMGRNELIFNRDKSGSRGESAGNETKKLCKFAPGNMGCFYPFMRKIRFPCRARFKGSVFGFGHAKEAGIDPKGVRMKGARSQELRDRVRISRGGGQSAFGSR